MKRTIIETRINLMPSAQDGDSQPWFYGDESSKIFEELFKRLAKTQAHRADLAYELNKVYDMLSHRITYTKANVLWLGFHKYGVDSLSFIRLKLRDKAEYKNCAERYHSLVYLQSIDSPDGKFFTVRLVEVTDFFK